MEKAQSSKINHMLASYMQTPAVWLLNLLNCGCIVINHGGTLRTADVRHLEALLQLP